jgi:hypothetical protein
MRTTLRRRWGASPPAISGTGGGERPSAPRDRKDGGARSSATSGTKMRSSRRLPWAQPQGRGVPAALRRGATTGFHGRGCDGGEYAGPHGCSQGAGHHCLHAHRQGKDETSVEARELGWLASAEWVLGMRSSHKWWVERLKIRGPHTWGGGGER